MLRASPGTYVLVLRSSRSRTVCIGRLGQLQLRPGYYLYVGSAFGPGGLQARIEHHCRRATRPHWHIDYLRRYTRLEGVWYCCRRCEHEWAVAVGRFTRGGRGDAAIREFRLLLPNPSVLVPGSTGGIAQRHRYHDEVRALRPGFTPLMISVISAFNLFSRWYSPGLLSVHTNVHAEAFRLLAIEPEALQPQGQHLRPAVFLPFCPILQDANARRGSAVSPRSAQSTTKFPALAAVMACPVLNGAHPGSSPQGS